jgi:hypothetical protein
MLPAPASLAAAPSAMSGASWNPAVPPPPVGGAAVGNELADGLRVGADDAGRLVEGLADGLPAVAARLVEGLPAVAGRLVEVLTEGLALAFGVLVRGVPLAAAVRVGEPAAPGENVAGVAGGEDPVQAETDAVARTVKVAKPAAVSLALSPFPAD